LPIYTLTNTIDDATHSFGEVLAALLTCIFNRTSLSRLSIV